MSTASSSSNAGREKTTTMGITLANGSRIVHGAGSNVKIPFKDLGFPVTMHELSANEHTTTTNTATSSAQRDGESGGGGGGVAFRGQFGFIEFDTSIRLPRHVHIAPPNDDDDNEDEKRRRRFVCERILVLAGVALVELNGEVYVIPPGSLVTIAPGVPHTWTACPAGVSPAQALAHWDADMTTEADRIVSEGRFTMVYEYEEETGFFPTRQTETLQDVGEYVRAEEAELEGIRFREMSKEEVGREAWFVWDRELKKVDGR